MIAFLSAINALPLELVPIRPDGAAHNVLITADGARYTDFEDACFGPRESDVGWLPDVDVVAFEPLDRRSLSVLSCACRSGVLPDTTWRTSAKPPTMTQDI